MPSQLVIAAIAFRGWEPVVADEAVKNPCRPKSKRQGCNMLFVLRFLADDSAATSIEYAMIAVGIAVVVIAVVQGLGTTVNTLFESVSSSLK
jgi:pilus assembly protein Flp/PilA